VTYDPALRTTGDLLKDWAAIMRVLQARDVIRTDNNPVGDIAEAVVHAHYGGERGGFNQKGWDVTRPDGMRLQVKALKITAGGNPSRNLSPISRIDYDVIVVVIFDEDFRVTEALWVPREVIEELFPNPTPKGLRMRVTQALRADPLVKTVDMSDAYCKLHA
jgi:hypothetical protein